MGATYKLKRKKADGTLEDVALAGGLPFVNNITAIEGSTNNPTKWYVANVGGVTTPTDGMTIAVRTPNGGHSYGIALSINGGNNYYPVIRNKDTQISTQYPQGVTLILTFNSTQEVGSYLTGAYAKITGCWQIADYSDDRYVSQTYTTTNDVYPLLFRSNAGKTSTSNILSQTRYANNLYVNPATGTVYANDFVVGGQSIVGGGVITELGNQGHADAETTIIQLLAPSTVPAGKYFYTYYNDCGYDAVFVICNKDEYGIRGTQLTSEGQFRKFWVDENGEHDNQCLRDLGGGVITDLNLQSSDVRVEEIDETGILVGIGEIEIEYDNGNYTYCTGKMKLPLIAGDNVAFEHDTENGVVKISATGGGGSGGVRKLTPSTTHSLTINSTTVGAYFNVFGCVEEADELTIGSNSISLDSEIFYFVSIEGKLTRRANNNNYWNVMATLKQHGGTVAYYSYYITSSSGFNIADTGQVATGDVVYSGILCE